MIKQLEKNCKGCRTYYLHYHGTDGEGCQILFKQHQCSLVCICSICILKFMCVSPCMKFLEFLCDKHIISVEEKNRSIRCYKLDEKDFR